MIYKLYCHQCKKDFDVNAKDFLIMQKEKNNQIINQNQKSFEYINGCFHRDLNLIKQRIKNG